MPIPWNDDPPGAAPLLRRNLEALLTRLIDQVPDRLAPTDSLAQGWHRAIFDGVELPVPYDAGEVRDDDPDFPELVGYEVQVGPHRGAPAREVPAELERFEERWTGLPPSAPCRRPPRNRSSRPSGRPP